MSDAKQQKIPQPTTWKDAKAVLAERKQLDIFLKCRNPKEFEMWLRSLKETPETALLLAQCWALYYYEFGPYGTFVGRTDVPSPDNATTVTVQSILDSVVTAKTIEWQIRWSNSTAEERKMALVAAEKWDTDRPTRLKLDAKEVDVNEGMEGWEWGRYSAYTNYLNRRGHTPGAERRAPPSSEATATSKFDWNARNMAFLHFAAFPNMKPARA